MSLRFAVALLSCGALAASAAPPAKLSPETQRLMDVARVWITADYFHPYLAYRDIDWDGALTAALPKIRAAKSSAELTEAVNAMLSPLHDPLTSATPQTSSETPQPQRSRFHQGLFVSGFLTKTSPSLPATAVVNMENGIKVQIRLSEPATAGQPASQPQKRAFLDTGYPTEEGRILAAFRIWGAIRYFFAYKDLIDEDWDALVAEYLPKLIAAKEARDYQLTIAELISHLSDSNATVTSPVLAAYFGEARPPVRIRLIEKKPTITALSPEAEKQGAKVGDIVVSVDGENTVERVKREANFLSASTPAGLGDQVARLLLDGPAAAPARLAVARSGDTRASVELPRASAEPIHERNAVEPIRILPGSFAYVDLDRLTPAAAGTLYQQLKSAKALIFDFRGNCQVDARLLLQGFPKGAGRQTSIVTGPLAYQPDLPSPDKETATASYFQIMKLPPVADGEAPPFQGPVVLLIDERTKGKSEQAVLQLSAATHVEIVGTPSAGAPSETSELHLPGNIRLAFSGQDVRLTNTGQLQRQGIQPSVTVPTTLAAVRAGRDEQLEKAQQGLRNIQ